MARLRPPTLARARLTLRACLALHAPFISRSLLASRSGEYRTSRSPYSLCTLSLPRAAYLPRALCSSHAQCSARPQARLTLRARPSSALLLSGMSHSCLVLHTPLSLHARSSAAPGTRLWPQTVYTPSTPITQSVKEYGLDSEFFFWGPYYFPSLGNGAPSVKRLFGKKFSPLRGETWTVCSPPRVVSHGNTGSPLRPPNLGEIGGKAKTLTPNISSPEGGRGVIPVPYDAPRRP